MSISYCCPFGMALYGFKRLASVLYGLNIKDEKIESILLSPNLRLLEKRNLLFNYYKKTNNEKINQQE